MKNIIIYTPRNDIFDDYRHYDYYYSYRRIIVSTITTIFSQA